MARRTKRFVLCVRNGSYKASLEPRKVYRVIDDARAEANSLVRVVDDSGDDYLFPAELFVSIDVPAEAISVFAAGTAASRSLNARS